mgnify:CR=1 FL=1
MLVRTIDFETTGFPPTAAVIEAAWCDLDTESGRITPAEGRLCNPFRVNPDLVMTPEAMAVHHIIKADLADAASVDVAFRDMAAGDHGAWAAHNAAFEREFFGGGAKPWLCTMKAARRIWPDAPSHSNQVLRYWRGLDGLPDFDRALAALSHRAAPDAYVTAFLLRAMLETGVSVEQMIGWTDTASLLPRVFFGKHRGASWEEVPLDYLQWLSKQTNLEPDVRFTVKHHIGLRHGRAM